MGEEMGMDEDGEAMREHLIHADADGRWQGHEETIFLV
jgi:hypothetical protein